MGLASDKFLSKLKEEIDERKKRKSLEKEITHSSFKYFTELIDSNGISVFNIKDFMNKDISFFCDIRFNDSIKKLESKISSLLFENDIEHKIFNPSRNKFLISVRIEDRSMISADRSNYFLVEISNKNAESYLIKFLRDSEDIIFSILENKRFLKFYVYEKENYSLYKLSNKEIKNKEVVITGDNRYKIFFDSSINMKVRNIERIEKNP